MASNEERIPEGLDDLLGDIRSEKSIEPTVKKISAENFGIAKSVENIRESQQSFKGAETSKRLTLVERKSLANERKITILKNILGYQKSDLRKNLANVTPQAVMLRNLDAILETLREEAKLEKKDEETDRRKAENTRRRLAEERIEKRYEGELGQNAPRPAVGEGETKGDARTTHDRFKSTQDRPTVPRSSRAPNSRQEV